MRSRKITTVTKKLSVSTRLDLITVLANWDLKAMELAASVSRRFERNLSYKKDVNISNDFFSLTFEMLL